MVSKGSGDDGISNKSSAVDSINDNDYSAERERLPVITLGCGAGTQRCVLLRSCNSSNERLKLASQYTGPHTLT